jgi:hypothetical protein
MFLIILGGQRRICIIQDWLSGKRTSEIETTYTKSPFNRMGAGDIRRIADGTRFHLSSAYHIATIAFPGLLPSSDERN